MDRFRINQTPVMSLKPQFNRVGRVVILALLAVALLIYLFGCVANIFGFMDLRPSDNQITSTYQDLFQSEEVIQFYQSDGIRIAYIGVQSTDPETNVAIIYIHGSPGSLDANSTYLMNAHLQSHAAQYTYDRVGYGGSNQADAEQHLAEQAAHLEALIRFIGGDKCILVGHSLGCTIAACLAVDQPDLVDGLVMVAPPLDPALEPSSWWRSILNFPVIRLGIPKALRVSNDELAPLKKQLAAYASKWAHVQCPVTVIQGRADRLVPCENVDFIKKKFVNAQLRTVVLEDAGHFIYWTHQELIADEVIQLLAHIR
jgi:pimeloyl-ACP methyl ester carboxylesterase